MRDATRPTPREAALRPDPPAIGPVCVRPLPVASRFSLRLREPPAEAVAGFRLDQAINRCSSEGDRWAARLGPDEWLLGGPDADTAALAEQICSGLADRFHALVDVSHRNVGIEVFGKGSERVLNAGCPLDLHVGAFPPGSAARTLLGKAEIVLLRPGTGSTFRVECWRSFSTYVHGFLSEAARQNGAIGRAPE